MADGDEVTTTNNAYIFSVTHNTIVSYIIYYYQHIIPVLYHERITVTD